MNYLILTMILLSGSAKAMTHEQLQSILCPSGWLLLKEVCFNPQTFETRFLVLSTNGHACPSKYMYLEKGYCIPKQK